MSGSGSASPSRIPLQQIPEDFIFIPPQPENQQYAVVRGAPADPSSSQSSQGYVLWPYGRPGVPEERGTAFFVDDQEDIEGEEWDGPMFDDTEDVPVDNGSSDAGRTPTFDEIRRSTSIVVQGAAIINRLLSKCHPSDLQGLPLRPAPPHQLHHPHRRRVGQDVRTPHQGPPHGTEGQGGGGRPAAAQRVDRQQHDHHDHQQQQQQQ
ncbi:unnamed protein product [Vitrella brassicaformis CCMP3155]|uniref:Uncharacterized protein n=1 Tax=Vitrella brassicaformis (strain CCMP3155) TaxID=1169540 RepID=A0A0G4GAZ8_VITBC|nr:unnamed protein product [Vitrella brassicaformis CCMP3155]|eukprot:CEM26298.1 unnamed protein product [Vitrella brassicaformis CCMP3155]